MIRNLGYACINMHLQKSKITTNRGMKRATFLAKGLPYASELALKNVIDLEKVIIWNEENDIKIEEDEAEVIAKEYYEKNKEEIQDVIRNYFDYISNSDNYLCDIDFDESDLLKKN